jgi:hypothetical protein
MADVKSKGKGGLGYVANTEFSESTKERRIWTLIWDLGQLGD